MPVTLQRIAVFCGASCGNDPEFALAAQALARCMAAQGIGLVYGGGTVGLMGEVAREVMRASGNDDNAVLGFIPAALAPKELSGEMIGKLTIVDDMHTRKAQMAQHADGFIALPGGRGPTGCLKR
ncbi:cytokinin riboside 5'-monophosphate phosphoribohydrolase, partial [Haematococcus lacustris]